MCGAGKKRNRSSGVVALAANQDTGEIVALCEGEDAKELTKAVPTPVSMCVLE